MNRRSSGWCSPLTPVEHMYVLLVVVVVYTLMAVAELVCATWLNSLGLFTHGTEMIFNAVLFMGLLVSIFANYEETRRYSLVYVGFVVKTNLVIGAVYLGSTVILGYMTLQNLFNPPTVNPHVHFLFYGIPLPSLSISMLSVFLIAYGHDVYKANNSSIVQAAGAGIERRAAQHASIYCHLLTSAIGSVATGFSMVILKISGWSEIDALCSAFNTLLMLTCALYLVRESIDQATAVRNRQAANGLREQSSGNIVNNYKRKEAQQLNNVFLHV